jgi:hypothetical protein
MALAAVGTLYLGLPQEVGGAQGVTPDTHVPHAGWGADANMRCTWYTNGLRPPAVVCFHMQGALLLLLFQLSHILEEKFTAKAEVSLERLFSAVPQQVVPTCQPPHPAETAFLPTCCLLLALISTVTSCCKTPTEHANYNMLLAGYIIAGHGCLSGWFRGTSAEHSTPVIGTPGADWSACAGQGGRECEC